MTKIEAIHSMFKGNKVTHEHFSSDEWMTMKDGKILLEDGVICTIGEFFYYRQGSSWNDGYSLWGE